jgi:ergothioneine biosynthesis protein EgtB
MLNPLKISDNLVNDFNEVREKTMEIFSPLDIEDSVIQSSSFGSPPNWHIAHVTWFFHKILEKYSGKTLFEKDINLRYLNSYYQRYGDILRKSERGKYPRPTVIQTIKYRNEIDRFFLGFLDSCEKNKIFSQGLILDVYTAINHEMQHQELMVYDLQHYFNRFPDEYDNYTPKKIKRVPPAKTKVDRQMIPIPGGIFEMGYDGDGFCYDNELPKHKVYLNNYKIDNALVTNGDFIEFIENGGYQNYRYWLSDGWDLLNEENWDSPLYWYYDKNKSKWFKKDFTGIHEIIDDEPVVNVSYYEADAFAKWAKKRLPTEAEWEKAASWDENNQTKTLYPWGDHLDIISRANLLESHYWCPSIVGCYPNGKSHYGCYQMVGDVWEWTSSEYSLFPGFVSRFEEYTDKWAINQKVLRGGSFATPSKQIRTTYRNYFKPSERILFAGFRCAKD